MQRKILIKQLLLIIKPIKCDKHSINIKIDWLFQEKSDFFLIMKNVYYNWSCSYEKNIQYLILNFIPSLNVLKMHFYAFLCFMILHGTILKQKHFISTILHNNFISGLSVGVRRCRCLWIFCVLVRQLCFKWINRFSFD